MLISDTYRALNAELHQSIPQYGSGGGMWRELVTTTARKAQCQTILDYGCGKSGLRDALVERHFDNPPFVVFEYDPCIPGKEDGRRPCDMVTCTDVLEHIEPDCIDDVLDDIKSLARKLVFLTVATAPAKKFLSDGRNAHLIQQPAKWWLTKIMDRWELMTFNMYSGSRGEFAVIARP